MPSLTQTHLKGSLVLLDNVQIATPVDKTAHDAAVVSADIDIDGNRHLQASWSILLTQGLARAEILLPDHRPGSKHHPACYVHLWPLNAESCMGACFVIPICEECLPGIDQAIDVGGGILLTSLDAQEEPVEGLWVEIEGGRLPDAMAQARLVCPT